MAVLAHMFKIEPLGTVLSGLISLPYYSSHSPWLHFATTPYILHNDVDLRSQTEPQIDRSPPVKREPWSAHFSMFLGGSTTIRRGGHCLQTLKIT